MSKCLLCVYIQLCGLMQILQYYYYYLLRVCIWYPLIWNLLSNTWWQQQDGFLSDPCLKVILQCTTESVFVGQRAETEINKVGLNGYNMATFQIAPPNWRIGLDDLSVAS